MHVYPTSRRGLNRPILRPLQLMTSASTDVISVTGAQFVRDALVPLPEWPNTRTVFARFWERESCLFFPNAPF